MPNLHVLTILYLQRLVELEESNKQLRERITDQEKASSVLQNKWLGCMDIIEKLEQDKSNLQHRLEENSDESAKVIVFKISKLD